MALYPAPTVYPYTNLYPSYSALRYWTYGATPNWTYGPAGGI